VSQPYRHPGREFLRQYPWENPAQAVRQYSDFLRRSAGLDDRPPIELSAIYAHFGIPEPRRAPLVDQQGILVNSDRGLILIKEDDPWVRQRFTEGHELMELLFDAQGEKTGNFWEGAEKERLCDRGAALLLMPPTSFVPQLHRQGLSLPTGQALAQCYQTSLLATLVHMVHHSPRSHALVLWHLASSRRDAPAPPPVPQLRVWWRAYSPRWQGGFIPRNKSIGSMAPQSCIARSYHSRQPDRQQETLQFTTEPCRCQVETLPIQIQGKSCVISLLTQSEG
jgi:hypothetical protein